MIKMISATILTLILSQTTLAKDKKVPPKAKISAVVSFDDARFYLPLKGAKATAGYVKVKNLTNTELTLNLVAAENFKTVETHETKEVDGKMAMLKVDSFKIAPHETLELKPGGAHLMLFEPQKEFTENEEVKFTFEINKREVYHMFKAIPRPISAEEHHHHE